MSALLVKEAPRDLHEWLKDEAQCNRRSLNQQILICLEWCMQTYGKAQLRNPFAAVQSEPVKTVAASGYLHGRALSSRLKTIGAIADGDAREMKASVRKLRASKARETMADCLDCPCE